jgi:hypothetical protein
VNAQGEAFEEFTEALNVSRRGLSVLTRQELPLYASLTIVIPGRGPSRPGEGPSDFFATATVVRVEKSGERNLLGIRLVGATLATYTPETG